MACPNFALAYNTRAIVYYRLKAWENAEKDFKKAGQLVSNLPFITGNLRLLAWARGQDQLKQARLANGQATRHGTTLVASSFDRYSVDIGDGRMVDVISIKNTTQTASLSGMKATLKYITNELRNCTSSARMRRGSF